MGHILFVVPIVSFASLWLYFLTCIAPEVSLEKKANLGFPNSIHELKDMAILMKMYYSENWLYVLVLFSSAYLYKQAFIIPGSFFLNVLAGALFGVLRGFPLCCLLTAFGATSCYLMSYNFGKKSLEHYFPAQIEFLQRKVESNSHQLIYYLLFLRLFPMTPNWLINLLSPIVGVPVHLFFFSVLVGLMPYNYLSVQAGGMLASLTSFEEVFTAKTFLQMALMAVAALGPSLFLKKSSMKSSAEKSKWHEFLSNNQDESVAPTQQAKKTS